MTRWLHARIWRGTVRVNGVDVSNRCAAVEIDQITERPVAVMLYRLTPDGHQFVENGQIALERVTGTLEVHLRPRPRGW